MARKRMYLFERAYVDYKSVVTRFFERVRETSAKLWHWFWKGPGSTGIEMTLRVAIILAIIGLGVLFYFYEKKHGRDFSAAMFAQVIGIGVFASLVLWSWKAPVHFAARGVTGATAAAVIVLSGVLLIIPAVGVFSVYLAALFVLTALSILVFLPMRGIHAMWLLKRRITYRCPYDDCSFSGLPIHICPECGEEYPDLKPGFYGIFHHICRHNDGETKLPTLNSPGRKKLERLCGGCKRPLVFSSIGEIAEHPIALVGGPGSGKTVFFRQAVRKIRERLTKIPGSKIRFDSQTQESQFNYDLKLLDNGQLPAKTLDEDMIQAFGLEVRVPRRLECLLYLFDSPGEHFQAVGKIGRKQVMRHLSGIVLLVDPFSLPALQTYGQQMGQQIGEQLKPSATPFQRIVEVLVGGVNLMGASRNGGPSRVPLAVVLSKTDALPLQDFPFLRELCTLDNPGMHHSGCRTALEKLGGGRGIHILEQRFANIRYFACSALGRMPDWNDSRPFQPVGVSDPVLWLLGLESVPREHSVYNN